MPGDAKLGLVLGVGLVILVAVLFRREGGVGEPPPRGAFVSPSRPAGPGKDEGFAPPAATPSVSPLVSGPAASSAEVPAVLVARRTGAAPAERLHRVEPGETLFGVALRYYGDGGRSAFLFHANREQVYAPDRLQPGTVLRVPVLTADEGADTP